MNDADTHASGHPSGAPATTDRAGTTQANLLKLGDEIRQRRRDLGIGLRELSRNAGTSTTSLSQLEEGPQGSGKSRTQPDKDLIRRIAFELGVPDAKPWLELAGYPGIEDKWGSAEAAFYLNPGDPIKPGARRHFERIEDALVRTLEEEGAPLAEVPVYAYLHQLDPVEKAPEYQVVGVPLRSGFRPGVFACLADREFDVHSPAQLAGKSIGTIGLYTEALVLLLLAITTSSDREWILQRPPKFGSGDDGLERLSNGYVRLGGTASPDDQDATRITITYNSGALVHLLRCGQLDICVVPPSPFEVWKIQEERTLAGCLTRLVGFNLAPGYRNYPSTLLVARRELLVSDDLAVLGHIMEEIEELDRENQRIAKRPSSQSGIDGEDDRFNVADMFRITPRPDLAMQLSSGVFISSEVELAQELREMSQFGSAAFESLPPNIRIPLIPNDADIGDHVVSRQELRKRLRVEGGER
jgi:transcriptional regulator with XRE-family HTH domain